MIRLVMAADQPEEREVLREAVQDRPDVNLLGVARDGQEVVQMTVEYCPDVVVLADDLRVLDGFEAAALIGSVAPTAKTLLVVDEETREVARRAMCRGVRFCLPRPLSSSQVREVVFQASQLDHVREMPQYQTAIDPARFPRIVAVTGAKGGIGKTSLSVNLAVQLAREERGPICLVDLYTQFGDVGTALNVNPARTLVDLAAGREAMDLELIKSATTQHPSGMDVILAATTPQALDALPIPYLEQVFWTLRQRYRFIVVDLPSVLYATTVRVLETAHLVLLVCNQMDLTVVADTRRWLEAVRGAHVPPDRLRLVMNRVSRENALTADAVEQALELPVWGSVPNDPGIVAQSMNEGRPFVLEAPDHPVSQAVRQIAEAVVAGKDAAAAPARRPAGGFLSMLGLGGRREAAVNGR